MPAWACLLFGLLGGFIIGVAASKSLYYRRGLDDAWQDYAGESFRP